MAVVDLSTWEVTVCSRFLTEERVSHLVDWLLSSDKDPPYGISEDKISVARQLCQRLFLPTPKARRS